MNKLTRRGFFYGAGSMCLSASASASPHVKPLTFDENKTIVLADIHVAYPKLITPRGEQPDYPNAYFSRAANQILAMRPLPRRVVVLGDISLWFGYRKDYEIARPVIDRLKAAGIQVYLVPGNHDHRNPMSQVFPEYAENSPVKGSLTSVVDIGSSDFYLLDTLHEQTIEEGAKNPGGGMLSAEQGKWLADAAKNAKRPFIVAAHHPIEDLLYEDKPLLDYLAKTKFYSGFIHGHLHRWNVKWTVGVKVECPLTRAVSIPSAGLWGDIGFAVLETKNDYAEITNVQSDFFYPTPRQKGETRPKEWDFIVKENNAQTCLFNYRG